MAALAYQLARKADFNKAVQYASAAGAYAAMLQELNLLYQPNRMSLAS